MRKALKPAEQVRLLATLSFPSNRNYIVSSFRIEAWFRATIYD